MSLANFGEREPATSARAGKKVLTTAPRALSPSRITRAKTRDTLLEEELKRMVAEDRNGALNIDPDRVREVHLGGKARGEGRKLDSNIFGGAKPNPVPSPRVRPVLADDQLSAIHGVDVRKEEAANKLAAGNGMVDMMVNAYHPVPIPNKEGKAPSAKKRNDENLGPIQGGVAGFGNLGAKSHHMEENRQVKPNGLGTRPVEPFVPEPKPSARFRGKKMIGARPDAQGSDGGAVIGSHTHSGIF